MRLPVKKTYKLYVGGAFPRSESGRSYEAEGANVARASRKDLRDAVRAAREAFPKWASMTAYNRGQVLYRVAEIMEGRRAQFVELTGGRGRGRRRDRLLGLVRGLGGQARAGARLVESRRGPVLQLHVPRADRRRRRRRAGGACAGGLRRAPRPGHRRRQRGRDRRLAEAAARRGDARRGPGHLGRAGRGRQRPHRAGRTSSARCSPRTWT